MRIAYLDCFAGISGDMFLGAMLNAGLPPQVLHDAIAALNLDASLGIETVDRSGISCTKVHVLEAGGSAGEEAHRRMNLHSHTHSHAHGREPGAQGESREHAHVYKHSSEGEGTGSAAGRSLSAIRSLIQAARLAEPVKQTAIRAFELLGQSEARIHNVPVEAIHFHEVGAVDAIVDIVAASAGIHHLQIGTWDCSPLNVGGGTVICAHGAFPVPAPATADLLRGLPTYSAHVQEELVTPTGAALLRALDPIFGQQPAMRMQQIGYGAGTRSPRNFPNVLRLIIGEATDAAMIPPPILQGHVLDTAVQQQGADDWPPHHEGSETVTVLETALDDLSPQVLAYIAEAAFTRGALDVMLTPVIMKKGRPGTLLTVLCKPSDSPALERFILSETSTLGVRIRQDRRICLERSHTTVSTPYGEIRVKIGSLCGEEWNTAPEFEDCRSAAVRHNVPIKQVQQAAIAAYLRWRSPQPEAQLTTRITPP